MMIWGQRDDESKVKNWFDVYWLNLYLVALLNINVLSQPGLLWTLGWYESMLGFFLFSLWARLAYGQGLLWTIKLLGVCSLLGNGSTLDLLRVSFLNLLVFDQICVRSGQLWTLQTAWSMRPYTVTVVPWICLEIPPYSANGRPWHCLEMPSLLLKMPFLGGNLGLLGAPSLDNYFFLLGLPRSADSCFSAEEACENPWSLGSDPVWED
jgi:hypothetical protein